ncbi:adenyl-nucleotide exchange factor sse1, partial [Linderina macrospora]
GTNPWIARFDVKNVEPTEAGDLATIKVKARLDQSGVLNITSAYTVEEVEVEEPVPQPEPKEGEEPAKPEMRKVKKLQKKADLPVSQASQCLDNETLSALTKKENEMHKGDQLVFETEHAKNSLEEYIYEIRGKVEGDCSAFVDPSERDGFLSRLMEAEDWLYEDGEDTTKAAYVEKLASLKAVGDPIVERAREDRERPAAARELREIIEHWAERAMSQEERFAHITDEERQRVIDRIEKVQSWLDEKMEKQSLKKKWEAPVVFANEIRTQKQELVYFASPIMSRPKPKEEPKPEEPAAASGAATPNPAQENPAKPTEEMDVD